MDYIILDDFEIDILQKQINTYIKKGYKPVGGIAIANQKDGFVDYIQGMIKDTESDSPPSPEK